VTGVISQKSSVAVYTKTSTSWFGASVYLKRQK